jgi:serine phosphatase RsbU (regulator of sigma subunit)
MKSDPRDARIAELEAKALDLEDALVRAESQSEVLENFCFGLERDHERARKLIEERDAMIFAELEQARRFQQAILTSLPHLDGCDLEVLYRPFGQVGGDLYDVARVDRSRVRLFVADATGHGIKAALGTMLIKAEYEALKGHRVGPASLLKLLSDKVHVAYRSLEMIFTAVVADFDVSTGEVRYACAAHPPPLALLGGTPRELAETEGSFVGLAREAVFEERTETLAHGDAVVLLTDGVAEAAHPMSGEFGERRILAAMAEAHAVRAPIAAAVGEALDGYLRPGAPEDDVTVLAVRRR